MPNKSKMFAFCISKRDYFTIQSKAEKAKQTDFITNSSLNKNITIVNGLDETARELKVIGRNLNGLTTLCDMGRIQSLDLMETKEQLRQIYLAILDINEKR